MAQPLPPLRRLLYVLGNPGWQIADRIVVLIAVYYYLPPPGRGLEPQVPEETSFGFVTVFGVAMLVGRLFDTAADPVVGFLSDRSRSRLGRRRSMLVYGIGPMVAIPALLFFPPFAPGSVGNGVWLGALLSVYFVAFTAYVAPYFALIPEIAWSQSERLRLSQWMSVAGVPALGLLTAWGVGLELGRAAGLSAEASLRAVVIALSMLAFVLCLGPILAVDESRHTRGEPSDHSFRRALGATLRNRAFLVYLLAQVFYEMGVTLVQPVVPYLATVVLGRGEGFTLWLTAALGVGLGAGFLVQRPLVDRFGPKRVMMGCVAWMALGVGLLGMLEPDVPGGPRDLRNLVVCLGSLGLFGVPAAGLLVLPHVIISQLIDADARRSGAARAAMFFGVQGLLTKWVYGLGTWLFSFLLLRYGKSPESALGVVLVGPVAAGFALAAFVLYAFYPEERVLREGAAEAL